MVPKKRPAGGSPSESRLGGKNISLRGGRSPVAVAGQEVAADCLGREGQGGGLEIPIKDGIPWKLENLRKDLDAGVRERKISVRLHGEGKKKALFQ